MALGRSAKEAVVAEISEVAKDALSLVGAEYRGLAAEDLRELRKQAHEQGVFLRVVKNTLAKRAVEGTDFECVQPALVGPLILAFSQEDPGAAARLIKDFAKEHDVLETKVVSVGGDLLAPNQLETLASLPTYDQAIAQLMSVMKAPIGKFVRTTNAPVEKFVRTVDAIRASKDEA